MGDTSISWTDKTWNVTRGCRRISDGCGGANGAGGCYAERQAYRFSGEGQAYEGLVKLTAHGPRWTGVGRFVPEMLAQPLRWRKPVRVFVDSMSDLFYDGFTNEQIAAVFGVMAACPQHTFQILTKRADRMRQWFEWVEQQAGCTSARLAVCLEAAAKVFADTGIEIPKGPRIAADAPQTTWPLRQVWLGVSVEHQAAANERIPELLRTPAAVRFLSCEPLLGPLDLRSHLRCGECGYAPIDVREHLDHHLCRGSGPGISWVIVGCESGPGARPCSVEWLRSLRDQCTSAEVPFFLKQAVGTVHENYESKGLGAIEADTGSKRKGGGVIELPYLDGEQWAQMPEVRR